MFSDGKPADGQAADVLTAPGGKQGNVVDGPVDEWANGVADAGSDITITTRTAEQLDKLRLTCKLTQALLLTQTLVRNSTNCTK